MPYCTLNDILEAIPETNLIQLTDDDNSGAVNQAIVDAAIEDADNIIDGYLRGRYTLPLDPVPGIVRKLSVDIAVYHLYSRRFELEMPESMKERYRHALELLKMIQRGDVVLLDSAIEGERVYKTNKTADDRVFDKDTLGKY